MSYEATFTWPHPAASNVVLTGTFDNWSCSYPMKRTSSGFTEKVNIPYASKVLYKFVVDGQWLTSNEAPTEWDNRGNVNNVFNSPAAPPPAPPSPELAPVAAPIEVEAIKEEPLEDAYVVPDTPTTAVETPRSPTKELFITIGAPTHEKDIPVIIEESPRDVPVVEISPPEELPSAEETGTGLGEDPALARAILESLEDEEDKVVIPEKAPEPIVEVKNEEEAPVVEEAPAPAPAPVSAPAPEPTSVPEPVSVPAPAPAKAETPAPIETPAPVETPAPAPVVEVPAPVEAPAPAPIAEASTPRPSTPPPKVSLPVEPITPVRGASTTTAAPMTSSAFSSTTTASSTTHSPEKPKPFPSRVSSESSPAKSLPKSEKRKKRPSFIKRITRVFSHKE